MIMKKFKVSKLMRDKTPQWMESKEIKYSVSEVAPESILKHLYLKLDEEVEELLFFCKDKHLSKSQANHSIMDEMADVLEVIESIAHEKGIKWEDVHFWKEKKIQEQGGFKKGLHVNWVQMAENHSLLKHYEENHHHPEIGIAEHHTFEHHASEHHSKHHEHHASEHHSKHHEQHHASEDHDHKKEAHGERHHDHHHIHYDHDDY